MLSKEGQKIVRAELTKKFGHCYLNLIRKHLKENAVNEYGSSTSEVKLDGGVSVCYTSNPNHFATFYVKLQLVGVVNTLALTKRDITRAGNQRGCEKHFAL
jgi:hypothetical protein